MGAVSGYICNSSIHTEMFIYICQQCMYIKVLHIIAYICFVVYICLFVHVSILYIQHKSCISCLYIQYFCLCFAFICIYFAWL